MNLTMNTKVMSESNLEEKLYELFEDLDQDFVGANGEEYLWNKAKLGGFKSNLEYSLNKAKEESNNIEGVIKSVIYSAMCDWDSYYESGEFNIEKINENYVVTIAVVDNY